MPCSGNTRDTAYQSSAASSRLNFGRALQMLLLLGRKSPISTKPSSNTHSCRYVSYKAVQRYSIRTDCCGCFCSSHERVQQKYQLGKIDQCIMSGGLQIRDAELCVIISLVPSSCSLPSPEETTSASLKRSRQVHTSYFKKSSSKQYDCKKYLSKQSIK